MSDKNDIHRIKGCIETIDYHTTQIFFENRATKYNEKNPYSVTMYQDNNPELAMIMNKKEKNILYPKLHLSKNSKVLDIACGIGRWADAITDDIDEYLGVDFSEELINIAKNRNKKTNYNFLVGDLKNIEQITYPKKYNVILMIGILMYLNDEDLTEILEKISTVCDSNSLICIREPIAIEDRLTLKDFYSNELHDNYNAIYRSREELIHMFEKTLLKKGFKIAEESYLFNDEVLNNRKETSKYFFILKKHG